MLPPLLPCPAGAYLTEGGVHFVAALRLAAAAAGWGEATAVVAASSGVSADLPQPDTLSGLVWFESGAQCARSAAAPQQCWAGASCARVPALSLSH